MRNFFFSRENFFGEKFYSYLKRFPNKKKKFPTKNFLPAKKIILVWNFAGRTKK